MTEEKFPSSCSIYEEGKEEMHLLLLQSNSGLKPIYDSVSQCNKCAFCSRVCPAQLFEMEETQSPRGRNMLLRFIMEGKVDLIKANYKDINAVAHNCILCGACSRECFAGVPAHEHMLELERRTGHRKLPLAFKILMSFEKENSTFFKFLMSFIKIINKTGFLFLLPFAWASYARAYLKGDAVFSLESKIKKYTKEEKQETKKNKKYIYLPSFEAKYLDTKTGFEIFKILAQQAETKTIFCESGAYDYIYGSLPKAKEKAAALVEKYYELCGGADAVVTDSLELFSYIKKYPQILYAAPQEEKAKVLAEKIIFIADILPAQKKETQDKIVLSKTNTFCAKEELFASATSLLAKTYGTNFEENSAGSKYPLPGAGYVFANKKLAKQILKEKALKTASSNPLIIYTTSISQRKLLSFALKKYYPKGSVRHISDL